MTFLNRLIFTFLILVSPCTLFSQSLDMTNAAIVVSQSIQHPVRESIVTIVKEEIRQRTSLEWGESSKWPESLPVLAVVLQQDKRILGKLIPGQQVGVLKEEGYRIFVTTGEQPVVWIMAADARGAIYGVGMFLRSASFSANEVTLPSDLDISRTPAYSIRGHQLGYRHTANSYDAWTVAQYDHYIRELALFGTNSIENIPFGKENQSPHMKISIDEMNVRMSEICNKYDLDYWVWTPATFDLKDLEKREEALKEHELFYKNCPRLDNIFVPGGDPGDNHPREVMPFLQDLYARIIKYHPKAGIWISLQGFNTDQVDYFYEYLKTNQPPWLRGVVTGPGSPPLAETRYRLPAQYKHRLYPDITHNVRCEYPVKGWDQAYALTLGREASNPRPNFYAGIHRGTAPFTDGFVSYSDGAHDDVNKFLWSVLGVSPERSARSIMVEYCRFFFGIEVAERAADGILALENNWTGPLEMNGGVEATFAYWQSLEKDFPALADNWRWQLLLLRAYYDTYTRGRLLHEQTLENEANNILLQAESKGAEKAMEEALRIVNRAETNPVKQELLKQIEHYAEALYSSIGLQTYTEKHQARGPERGCIMDFVHYPLNNRWWLADQFEKIRQMESTTEKLKALHVIATWNDPGPGSYYDDISNVARSPRVSTTVYDATDFAWWENGMSRARLSTQTFQNNPELEYTDLDPEARYKIRVAGYGEALIRVDGYRLDPVMYNKELEGFKEFLVPQRLVGDGQIKVTFDAPEESHLNWRQHSKVSDVWLIKRN